MNKWKGKSITYYMTTLNQAKKIKLYKIVGFSSENDAVLRRFMELGFTVGEKIKIVATSLQKKVFLIELRGYLLSVRAELLHRIEILEI